MAKVDDLFQNDALMSDLADIIGVDVSDLSYSLQHIAPTSDDEDSGGYTEGEKAGIAVGTIIGGLIAIVLIVIAVRGACCSRRQSCQQVKRDTRRFGFVKANYYKRKVTFCV